MTIGPKCIYMIKIQMFFHIKEKTILCFKEFYYIHLQLAIKRLPLTTH
jgi:hypothetical protein